jgi:hypothetical protein
MGRVGLPLSRWHTCLPPVTAWALTLLCLATVAGCFTPPVLELARTSTKRESYKTTIESVARAARLPSGGLLVCMEVETFRAVREQVHLEVPLEKLATLGERASLDFGRDQGFETSERSSALRYVFFEQQLEPGCPEGARPVPVQSGASLEGAVEEALYAVPNERERGIAIRYRSPEPLWASFRDIELAPVLGGEKVEVVPGKPAYWAVLPFAVLFDGLFVFLYFFTLFG